MVIRKLNGKEPTNGILTIVGSDLNNATATTKGVVQIGDGLSVSEGVISSTPKQYLYATKNDAAQVLNGLRKILLFNNVVASNGITMNANGEFYLTAGKVYRVAMSSHMIMDSANTFLYIGLYNPNDELYGHTILIKSVATTENESLPSHYEAIIAPLVSGNYSMKVNFRSSPGAIATLQTNRGSLIVQEL